MRCGRVVTIYDPHLSRSLGLCDPAIKATRRLAVTPVEYLGHCLRKGIEQAVEEAVTPQSAPGRTQNVAPVDDRTFTSLMEQLQEGYVASIAATAACTMERIPRDIYGFDVRFVRPGRPGEEEVTLNAQLKNTTLTKPDIDREYFGHQLKKRAYLETLALPRRGVKAILIVMVTSPTQTSWTFADHDNMSVRHCCYWACLEGHQVNPSVASPTVRIPTANIFDSAALTQIMDRLERGESLI